MWRSWTGARKADVGAYLYWLPEYAHIVLPSGETVRVGYHLVLYNRGPHCATDVNVKVKVYVRGQGSGWQDVKLADIGFEELPLKALDSGARYPIPWALGESGTEFRKERRFEVELSWNDSRLRGRQVRPIPLRMGNIGSAGA